MINQGKCPKCRNVLTSVQVEEVLNAGPGPKGQVLNYCCPFCHAILSTQMFPAAAKAESPAETKVSPKVKG